jgi:hypothetical protein
VVVLRASAGAIAGTGSITLAGDLAVPATLSGVFTVPIANPGSDSLVVEVVDGAGNVTTYTAKGANLHLVNVNAGPDQLFGEGIPTTFAATVPDFGTLAGPVQYFWDFGDGTSTSGTLTGPALTTTHQYSTSAGTRFTARLRVADANGGMGADDVVVTACWDNPNDVVASTSSVDTAQANFVGCHVTSMATTMTITLRMARPIAASAPSNDIQYRVYLTLPAISVQLKYRSGQVTGLGSLVVTFPDSGDEIAFTFALSEVGIVHGQAVLWSAETRAGVQATGSTGLIDSMPDGGTFSSTP